MSYREEESFLIQRPRPIVTVCLAAVLGVTLFGCDAGGAPRGTVAEAEGHTLSVDELVEILSSRENVPAREDVVRLVADFWVDYILLAEAAQRDSTLGMIDVTPLLQDRLSRQMIGRLRDSVIQVDTSLTEEELRERFAREAPDVEVRARHILLTYPEGAGAEARDSVLDLALELQRRARGGEDFGSLAREHSEDPGSARDGGDLGFFTRGEMVPPFEEAAFDLEPGEISDPVETPYGIHLIRMEERRVPPFDSIAGQYRSQVQQRMQIEAESTYMETVEGPAEIEMADEALAAIREIAERPGSRLSGRAARRPLMEYEGGAYTVGEFQAQMRNLPASARGQFVNATDEQLEQYLRDQVRLELLVAEAREMGLDIDEEELDSIRRDAHGQIVETVERIGLLSIEPEPGESVDQAIGRRVKEVIRGNLDGEVDAVFLGPMSYQLRRRFDADIHSAGVDSAVSRLQAARAQRPTQPPPGLADSLLGGEGGADTTGGGGN